MIKYLIVLACCASAAMAQAEAPIREQQATQTATEALLQVQASGEQASNRLQVQTARERDLSMQRWLESYKYAIPDFFRWTKVSSNN
ncbi:DUF3613 domain-containing protein [Pseudomonas putida]|uniref:DUF3613 domain-containing protein n=1 Tax=Pseudomonas putida TaxID=303 RepID=A0A7W2KZ85_PSEPU|nr:MULTISPECIES: DUF3613 domain-containing protein [Pseudomonas]MBA6115579.1 DUF3613 domain-containing protein [Pseudomonas putida]MBI6942361.1 DUF3613 domain-containing protein [Pseudomonas putida]MBI6956488.1 DUF3613 domain-containing protein [Pseudomonas putida]MCZ9635961.1 DUF3613 domain-containing protein [Pseudomonas putida]MEC4878886.1 DUF3613 domain-containing protein [Pseudomonas sp. NC26]